MSGAADERIWYDNLKGFLDNNHVIKFLPERDMSMTEQLNAALRFALYFSIILMIIRRSLTPIFIVLFVAVLTWGMNESQSQERKKFAQTLEKLDAMESRKDGICTRPTMHNPFMNVLSSDAVLRPNRPKACDASHRKVKKLMEDYYAHNLYRDSDDPLDRNTHSRQFYTMPVSTIPGDQTAFAKWLYDSAPTCKEGNGAQCATRLHRSYLR